MTLQEVFTTYDKAELLDSRTFLILCIVIAVLTFIMSKKTTKIFNVDTPLLGALLFAIIVSIFFITDGVRISDWKNEVYSNYIEELPIEKSQVFDYAITTDHPLMENNDRFTNVDAMETVTSSARIVFLKDGLKREETLDVKIIRDKEIDEPYFEYQYLDRNFPKTKVMSVIEIYKGYYNTILHVPANDK